MSYFPPNSHSKNKIEVKLDLSNYATKFDLKNAAGVNTSQFSKKDGLNYLKLEVDKLDIYKLSELDAYKLKSVSTDSSKPSDIVKIWQILLQIKIMLRSKILKITFLVLPTQRNSALDAKINKVKAEMPSITNLATDSALMVLK